MALIADNRGKLIILLTVLMALSVLTFDLSMPLGVAGGIPYVMLVLIARWAPWKSYTFYMAVLGTVLTIIGYFGSPVGGIHWVVLTNRALAIFAIWVATLLCIRIQKDEINLKAVVDTAADAIISINGQGRILTFNRAAVSIFGYSANEAIGNRVSMLMPPDDGGNHNDYVERYIHTGEKHIIGKGRQLQARHKDGHIFPIYLNVSETSTGKPATFTGIIHDLSNEEHRNTQLQRLWYVVEQSPISIIITDADGNIEYVNTCFKQLTGYTDEEVLGHNPRIMKSGHTQVEAYRQMWSSIGSGHIWRGVLQNKKKNGELFWISSTIYPITNQQGAIDRYIAFNEDITHLREKEDMLTHAMKLEAVGRMTNGIAHDFRNLLTIILGNLQLLQEGIIQKDSELITDALSAANDGSELIMRLLAFSRRKEQSMEAVEVNAFLQELLRLLQRTVNDQIEIIVSLNELPSSVKVDPNRLESAVLNLVTNAQDAMPNGGKLVITTDILRQDEQKLTEPDDLRPGEYVTITVADNGIGMNEETRQRALEAFYSTKSSGTGLGLSMVNDFVTSAGGAIRIQSSPGAGTRIALCFPAVEATVELENKIEHDDSLPGGSETILLAEDRDKVRAFARRILTYLGYRVIEVANATAAMDYFCRHEDIDLLFSDIVMPGGVDGRELAKLARSRLPKLKVLLTSGLEFNTEDGRTHSVDAPFLPKPYTAQQLAQAIRSVLDTGKLTH